MKKYLILFIVLSLLGCKRETSPESLTNSGNFKVKLGNNGPWSFISGNATNDQINIGIFSYETAACFDYSDFNSANALYTKTTTDGEVYFNLLPGNYYAVVLNEPINKQAFQLKENDDLITIILL